MVSQRKNRFGDAIRSALVILLTVVPLAAMAGSAPPAKSHETSIPFADHGGIRDWRADGTKGMWIQAANDHWFYASFSSKCTALRSALTVRFIPQPNGVLSRWSSIRLEHDERCFFRNLQPSDAPPNNAEKGSAPSDATDKPATGSTAPDSNIAAPPAGALLALNLSPIQLLALLPTTAMPAGNEPPDPAAMPVIFVEASAPADQPPAPNKVPCGFASIARVLAHPAEAWRELAPLPSGSDVNACVEASAVTERANEPLQPVSWYE